MKNKASLRFRLIVGFLAVTVPLFCLLIYINYYAMDVVRNQVGQSTKNMLSMYMNEIDRTLEDGENYIYNYIAKNSDLTTYATSEPGSANYFFAKVRTQNQMVADMSSFEHVNMIFVYSPDNDELLSTIYRGGDVADYEDASSALREFLSRQDDASLAEKKWKVIQYSGQSAIVRLVKTDYGQVMGIWIDMNRLMVPFLYLDIGESGQAMFVSENGTILTDTSIGEMVRGNKLLLPSVNEPYRVLEGEADYIIVATKSKFSDVYLSLLVPESQLLQQLPYFQRLIYLIPLVGAAVLSIYLLFLRNTLLKPMSDLIKGMRQIKRGELRARLGNEKSKEFSIINDTFNDMAAEIQDLKINVYEEQIRTQKAELKHLQAQINPHFLLNAINIIYNLAELNKNDLIKRMSTHISKYFRFVTRTNVSFVSVANELEHIESYLEIQRLRFPNYLKFELSVEQGLEQAAIPPLLIQPFVENAIKHGFEMSEEPFQIEVHLRWGSPEEEESPTFEIIILDNGRGISEEQLAELNDDRSFLYSGEGNLGIWNVRQRLKLQYGAAAQMVITPGEPKGTCIKLMIPFRIHSE
ncbi:MAG TPA: histidine kinase [Candidatus Udaeobacter sp.]|nr:histidine kinase [Candidatus Udaeobacter sp.]